MKEGELSDSALIEAHRPYGHWSSCLILVGILCAPPPAGRAPARGDSYPATDREQASGESGEPEATEPPQEGQGQPPPANEPPAGDLEYGRQRVIEHDPAAKLSIEPGAERRDFGLVSHGSILEYTLELRSTGRNPVEIR